ncbi:MAG: cytochrome c biogenesis protein ResB [Planctomycetes bacterium]|nr:cytochrome c biogenesis protein ResB [Planctomycetota bacterium]
MSQRNILLTIPLRALSSSKLALVLIVLLILFSIAGAVLPQKGMFEIRDIELWQQVHTTLTKILEPAGLFHVFHSWPFLITISILGVNILTCTLQHFIKDGGFAAFKGPRAIEKAGFILLHFSLIVLFAGGFLSAATRLDGHIVLTEGQSFRERHDNYLRLVEGPLRPEHHEDFVLTLKQVETKYEKQRYQTDVTSSIEILLEGKKAADGIVKINKPFTYKGFSFTQDQTGFSPRIVIREKESGKLMLDSFVALKTFQNGQDRKYHDFLPLPFLKNTVIITLYPSYTMENGRAIKTSEQPEKPLLMIEEKDESGQDVSQTYLHLKSRIELGEYSFNFTDIRCWSSFKVVEDSGYYIVCVSLWLGLVALLLRYVPDIRKWFGIKPSLLGKHNSQQD